MPRLSNYQKSNSITTIDFHISKVALKLMKNLLGSKSEAKRQRLGTALLDELADLSKTDICNLKVSSAQQYHKK
jgi:CRISPR/Cas system CMR-associated protein Cmr3 (group 5 of RAMP superfamily)